MKRHKIFETNPNLKEVHMTSDGEAFYNDNDAKMHAKSLKDKTVELVINPSLIDVISEEVYTEDELKTDEGSGEENTEIEAQADGSINELTNEEPVIEVPAIEAPVVETPTVEAPVVEAPVIEAPVVETPTVEVSKAKSKKSK